MTSSKVKFQAVSPRRLTDEIANQIERLILNHELQEGDALPPERELATQLHVSRNILRESIRMLAQKGLLEVRPGLGTYVARPSLDVLEDTLAFLIRFSETGIYDLFETRSLLEVETAGLAAERATEEDRAMIATRLEELEAVVINDLDAYIEADVRFHAAIAAAAKNEVLELLFGSIRSALRENIRFFVQNQPTVVGEAHTYHRKIAEAILNQCPAEARLAMQEHLEILQRRMREQKGHS